MLKLDEQVYHVRLVRQLTNRALCFKCLQIGRWARACNESQSSARGGSVKCLQAR